VDHHVRNTTSFSSSPTTTSPRGAFAVGTSTKGLEMEVEEETNQSSTKTIENALEELKEQRQKRKELLLAQTKAFELRKTSLLCSKPNTTLPSAEVILQRTRESTKEALEESQLHFQHMQIRHQEWQQQK
jgi:hypothetical protein